jgi:hypothetical protein
MNVQTSGSDADAVRNHVISRYIQPAREAGCRTVTVRAGEVQKELGWWNRVPSVCSALDARIFERMAQTSLVARRGPRQSTTVEWDFGLEKIDPATNPMPIDARRLVATWDGEAFRPVAPPGLSAGQRVVLTVSPTEEPKELAGEFGEFVGTLSPDEASEMDRSIRDAFETIGHDW